MGRFARAIFGAHGQLAVGVAMSVAGVVAWWYGTGLRGEAKLNFLFHISMFFGLVACYAIVSNALGYRATERVETAVVENIENAETVKVENGGDDDAKD